MGRALRVLLVRGRLPLSGLGRHSHAMSGGRIEFSLPQQKVARSPSRDLFASPSAEQADTYPVSRIMPRLSCPKCDAPLHRFERSGVVIERCTHCRGVFLDQGELEHLIDVEGALVYDGRRGQAGQATTDDNPTASARARGGRPKIPVTERILDFG